MSVFTLLIESLYQRELVIRAFEMRNPVKKVLPLNGSVACKNCQLPREPNLLDNPDSVPILPLKEFANCYPSSGKLIILNQGTSIPIRS